MREREYDTFGMQPSNLIDGQWTEESLGEPIESVDPASGAPIAAWPGIDATQLEAALAAGRRAYDGLAEGGPEMHAALLRGFADAIEGNSDRLVSIASAETALSESPRLRDVELPRTVDQLRQAASAAAGRVYTRPVISPHEKIASMRQPIPGLVFILGPNNFPFAFNPVSGGDAAAALATGHPVLAKSNPGHPGTTQLLAQLLYEVVERVAAPPATVQLIHSMEPVHGTEAAADHRTAATAFTGSRKAGLALKASADSAGNPIYLEMSSTNPVVVLGRALQSRGKEIGAELAQSMLMGAGQFCTSPGLIFLDERDGQGDAFIDSAADALRASPQMTMLSPVVARNLDEGVAALASAGAEPLVVGQPDHENICRPALLQINAGQFLAESVGFQRELFGSAALIVRSRSLDEIVACISRLEGNLTGTVYVDESDAPDYEVVSASLRERVGRVLNNKPPTGVAVVPAMNHGGPFPATGHPGFTAVGIPASLDRFTALLSFDNVQDDRLPSALRASNPLRLVRNIDGEYTSSTFRWGSDE